MTGSEGPALYAFSLGLVGALNPCGFPLLPAYMSLFLGAPDTSVADRLSATLAGTGFVTAGFVAVFGVVGLVTESGIQVVAGWVPWAMIPLACGLMAIGLGQALGRPLHVPLAGRYGRLDSGYRPAALVGFGVSYGMASLSCALPVFLAGVAGSFTRSGFVPGLYDFVAYALGMGLLLGAAALAAAVGGAGVLRHLRGASRAAPRAGGALLAVVGAYLAYYWTYALVAPSASPALVGGVEHLQAALAGWASGSVRWAGAAIGAVVLAAMGAAAWRDRPAAGTATRPRAEVEEVAPGR